MNYITNQKGFTLVELLIVIAVIGILAGISAVSYMGSQDRARTAKAKVNADTVKKVAETYYGKNNLYPTAGSHFRSGLITVPADVTISSSTNPTVNATTGESLVGYRYVSVGGTATGACIYFWDFTSKSIQAAAITRLGTATTANCSATLGTMATP